MRRLYHGLNEDHHLMPKHLERFNPNPAQKPTSRSRRSQVTSTEQTEKLAQIFNYLARQSYHKIVHFEGNPQGPSLSFASGCAPFIFCFGVWVFFVAPFPFSAFVTSFAPPPFAAPPLEPSSQKLTLLIAVPKDFPWIVASSSSRGVG